MRKHTYILVTPDRLCGGVFLGAASVAPSSTAVQVIVRQRPTMHRLPCSHWPASRHACCSLRALAMAPSTSPAPRLEPLAPPCTCSPYRLGERPPDTVHAAENREGLLADQNFFLWNRPISPFFRCKIQTFKTITSNKNLTCMEY